MEDEDQLDETGGALGSIRDQLGELLDPSTTVEAQSYARQFLNRELNSPLQGKQSELMTEMEKNAEQARAVLRAAREKLMARRFNPADKWYALSAALGAPTRVGGIGDLAGRAATALGQSTERRRAFQEKQDTEALGYDEQISKLNQSLLGLKMNVLLANQKNQAALAQESLKTLGKRVNGQTVQNKAQQAVDREFAKDYVDWIQNGSTVANKSQIELQQAVDRLRGYSIGPDGQRQPITEGDFLTRKLGPTGAVSGSIATVPYIGKAVQDVLMPGSADIREIVESTVQGSLRPILGAQFTEKEGERLISRVYNPRMKPEVNALRVQRLLNQIAEAAENKNAAARWFETHGTLMGFKGRLNYTLSDFMPNDINELSPPQEPSTFDQRPNDPDRPGYTPQASDDMPAVDPNAPPVAPQDSALPKPIGQIDGRPVYRKRDLPPGKKKGWLGFAEGGAVSKPDTILVQLDDGTVREAPATATQADFDQPPDDYDPILSRAALAGLGAGVGYVGSKAALGLGNKAHDLVTGTRETPAESRLLRLMEKANMSPSALVGQARRYSRMGVPTLALDASDDLRALASSNIPQGGSEAADLLDRLERRQIGSRDRTLEQVNRGLKPDDYFEKEQELKTALYGNKAAGIPSNSESYYRAAEQAFPAVRSQQLTKLLDTPSGQKAVKAAMKTMKDKQKQIGNVNPVNGAVTKYSLEFLNQVKIELDDMISKEEAKGATGKGKALRDLRNAFRSEIDTATTDPTTGESPYKEARGVNEQDRAHLDALHTGREEFGSMQPQEVKSAVDKMNFEQKDAFRTGVAQKISEMINSPSTDINAARRLIGSPAMRSKLSMLFDTPQEFKVFETALQKEMEMYEESQGLLNKRDVLRRRQVQPEEGVVARGARKAPTLGIFSPTYWALKYLRQKPEVSEKEASEVISMLKSGSLDELTNFEKRLGPKFGRKAARKARSSKVAAAAAALGAGAGALLGGDDDKEEEIPPEEQGLTVQEREWANTPAMAKGGKVELLKELIETLKNRMSQMDPEWVADQVRNISMKTGESPTAVRGALADTKGAAPIPVKIPAQPEQLEPYKVSMDLARKQLQQIKDSLTLRNMEPHYADQMAVGSNAADLAYERMFSEPTPQNMQTLSELVRSLQAQAERRKLPRKQGGRINRQFGGMTRHG